MPVTTNQIVKRQGRDGKIRYAPVAAATAIYEGTLVFLDSNGFATNVKTDENTVFAGVARDYVDNSNNVDGTQNVEFWTDGDFELPSSSLADADVGVAMHASDNYTTTKTATSNPAIGTLSDVVSATVGVVSIQGLGE